MSKKNKIKFELIPANNGYILGLVNPNYGANTANSDYYKDTWVGEDIPALFNTMLSQLVVDRITP